MEIDHALSVCEQEVECLGVQLETLRQHRRGLMQKLLTRQVRVTGLMKEEVPACSD